MAAIPKNKRWKNAAYLNFVRRQSSVVSSAQFDIVAHHIRFLGGGGMGVKPHDYFCVPLTTHEHTRLHQMGEAVFWREHFTKPIDAITRTMKQFLELNEDDVVKTALAQFQKRSE